MKITNSLFEQMLTTSNISKREFSNYSKIPYNTVLGWKKRNQIPPYAMVLLKDMNYRKKLNIETANSLRKDHKYTSKIDNPLTKNEEKRLKSVFWGTNYTINDIINGIQRENQKIMKRIEENLPLNLQKQIVGKFINA